MRCESETVFFQAYSPRAADACDSNTKCHPRFALNSSTIIVRLIQEIMNVTQTVHVGTFVHVKFLPVTVSAMDSILSEVRGKSTNADSHVW